MGDVTTNKHKTKSLSAALLAAALLTLAGCAQNGKAPETTPASVTEPAAPTAEPTTEAATTAATPAATTAVTTPVATTAAETAHVPEESDEANQKAQEQQTAPEDVIAAPEQEEQAAEDKQERNTADDKPTYTTDGIPLTTDGDLTAPVKPTKNYKLPKNELLEFTGDASTALVTELPEGCVWTPTVGFPNGYTNAAGNYWLNNKRPSDPAKDGNRNGGYYDPSGDYHTTQDEIDFAEAMWKRDREITDIIMSGGSLTISEGGMEGATQEDFDELDALLGI